MSQKLKAKKQILYPLCPANPDKIQYYIISMIDFKGRNILKKGEEPVVVTFYILSVLIHWSIQWLK